jgi:hypothetical protein
MSNSAASARHPLDEGVSVLEPGAATGVYLRGNTFWIRYHGPRRDGTWGQICESAKTRDPEAARRLREIRLREVADHREGNHLFRRPHPSRAPVSLKSRP